MARAHFETTIGAHHCARHLVSYAWLLGLDADVQSFGGWFTKVHYFVVKGDPDAIARWLALVESTVMP